MGRCGVAATGTTNAAPHLITVLPPAPFLFPRLRRHRHRQHAPHYVSADRPTDRPSDMQSEPKNRPRKCRASLREKKKSNDNADPMMINANADANAKEDRGGRKAETGPGEAQSQYHRSARLFILKILIHSLPPLRLQMTEEKNKLEV